MARTPQMLSLERFSEYLDAGVLVAVNVDDDEVHLEGSYWLAQLNGPSFVLEEDTMHCGQQYCKDWIVAPGYWYKLQQLSPRGYKLLPTEVSGI